MESLDIEMMANVILKYAVWQFRINNTSVKVFGINFLKELFPKHGFVQENLSKLRIEENNAFS